jgi:actin-like ATPase involved in cell morphogenesis
MSILTKKKIEDYLRTRHNITVGVLALETFQTRIRQMLKAKIGVSGRCYKTGKKKAVSICVNDILGL